MGYSPIGHHYNINMTSLLLHFIEILCNLTIQEQNHRFGLISFTLWTLSLPSNLESKKKIPFINYNQPKLICLPN